MPRRALFYQTYPYPTCIARVARSSIDNVDGGPRLRLCFALCRPYRNLAGIPEVPTRGCYRGAPWVGGENVSAIKGMLRENQVAGAGYEEEV